MVPSLIETYGFSAGKRFLLRSDGASAPRMCRQRELCLIPVQEVSFTELFKAIGGAVCSTATAVGALRRAGVSAVDQVGTTISTK